MEIERKFIIKSPPAGWRRRPSTKITQGYFDVRNSSLEIRLRQEGNHHVLTIKTGDGLRRGEYELAIPVRQFQQLWPLTRGRRLTKRRYRMALGTNTIEMDVYTGSLRGLITAEVEFPTSRDSRRFKAPVWFGREVTHDRQFSSRNLAAFAKANRG